ncbi:MAG: TIM barrel protein [Akkermansiaceae bacterium]|nr:TIM barrel protein [Akkermansiaceae bacterium]
MKRRDFATKAAGTVAAAAAAGGAVAHADSHETSGELLGPKFKLKYAPHHGQFKHHAGDDYLDQIKFAADAGFTAWEDNGMMKKEPALQEKAAAVMAERGVTMGVFVSYASFKEATFADPSPESRQMLKERMQEALECAKRVNAKWTTVVPGSFVNNLEWDYQTANVVDTLKMCAEILEPAGVVMVLEPLNPWRNHPGCFLSKIPQAYQICKAVGSPSCKILNDLYHQQITEGNLIPNMDKAWEEIAYIQVGDNPGRKEPGTGEINYRNIFKHLKEKKNFTGVVGMEHGISRKGKEGEVALIQAYRDADNF